jgi:hypothetical protein
VLRLAFLLTVSSCCYGDFSGYLKSFALVQDEVPLFSLTKTYQSQNSLRLMWSETNPDFAWEFHYDLSPVFSSRSLGLDNQTLAIAGDAYRLTDIDNTLTDDDKRQTYQNLDRLNIQLHFSHGDLTIGRQAIALGSARIINPTDVFIPFNVQTFNQEYRIGIDAIRYQAPMGELGEFDVGIVTGDSVDTSALFVQLKANVAGNDLQFSASRFAMQSMAGVGVQSALGSFGFWFEAATVRGDEDYTNASVGLDYAFSESVFSQIEYHYNGAGSKTPVNYLGKLQTIPYQRGGVFLFGQHYIIPVISFRASALWSIALQGVFNLDDHSAFTSISAEYNVAEDIYMDIGLYRFSGDSIKISQTGAYELTSEYGTSPNLAFFSVRYYF